MRSKSPDTTPSDHIGGPHIGADVVFVQIGKVTVIAESIQLHIHRPARGYRPVYSMRLDEGNPMVKESSLDRRDKERKRRNTAATVIPPVTTVNTIDDDVTVGFPDPENPRTPAAQNMGGFELNTTQ